MIVQCPECQTKYKIDDARIKSGVKLKCSRCQHIFSPEIPEEEGEELGLDFLESEEEVEVSPDESTEPPHEDEGKADEEKKAEFVAGDEQGDGEANLDEESLTESKGESEKSEEKKGKKKGKARWVKFLLIIFLLLILSGGGAGVYFYYPQIQQYISKILRYTAKKKPNVPKEDIQEKVKNIALEDIRQYFVTNDKIGQLFVLEGKAVNKFNVPKELIKLRAILYDDKGHIYKSKDFYCGNTVSLFQLQTSTQEAIESSLNDRLGILTNNTFLKPGASTPFMVVFYAPPENVQEFGLEVIDVKDPPRK